jgi:hypothetical protein
MNELGKLILADKNYFQHQPAARDAATLILLDRSGPAPRFARQAITATSSCRASSYSRAAGSKQATSA